MRTVVITLVLCLVISQTQAFHMPKKICKKVEAGGIKMVSALLSCVEKMALPGAAALAEKAQFSTLGKKAHAVKKLKAKQDALAHKAQASALSKKSHMVQKLKAKEDALAQKGQASSHAQKAHVVEKLKAKQDALAQKAQTSAHAQKALAVEKLRAKQDALAQKVKASALGKKAHMMKNIKARQEALTKKIIHTLLSKVGCSKRRRLFHHSFKGVKAGLAKKALKKVMALKKKAAKKLKNMACGVIKKACDPACTNVVNVASKLASTFGIPLACVSDSLKKSCMVLCHKFCSRRRLAPRRLA